MNEINISEELKAFGASPRETLLLDSESHNVIDYLSLIWRLGPGTSEPNTPRPTAVVEANGRPILFVVSADALTNDRRQQEQGLMRLRNIIACRGDGAYFAVLRPGILTVYRRGFAFGTKDKVDFSAEDNSQFIIRDLALGNAPRSLQDTADARALHDLLFDLMAGVSKTLKRSKLLRNDDDAILALVGRALFARFLIDRGLLTPTTLPEVFDLAGSPICFTDAISAARTCEWMEETFNGDLLPLPSKDYQNYFASFNTRDDIVFKALSKIVERTEDTGQRVLDWGWLDFAHVPVGILSEVYEDYAHEFFKDSAVKESIRYTPRYIAEFMINEAFDGIHPEERHNARVLDPAAGAGVFLVLALRRLFLENWKVLRRRPTTSELQKILLEQIAGFDINRHALKLAAFSLHLTTIELEPTPDSVRQLRFVKLEGIRLLSARKADEPFPAYPVLGSLGEAIGNEHDSQYSIIIGNPPWTAWEGPNSEVINEHATSLTKKIAESRLGEYNPVDFDGYRNPDKVPDIPFVWRSMNWAKPGGIIALALHGRLIFKRSGPGCQARNLLFRCLRVTGIMNGGGLDSSIWPGMNQPFCLLFARNTVPTARDTFRFVSAEHDEEINRVGFMRIDPDSAEPVQHDVLAAKPHLLKTLFRGTSLDAELIDRLTRLTYSLDGVEQLLPTLAEYWSPRSGLYRGVGYQVAGGTKSTLEIRKLQPKDMTATSDLGYVVEPRRLQDFTHKRLNRPRKPDIYKPPLVIVSTALGENSDKIRARIALGKTPIAYAETFFGCSAHGHPDAADLARYLFLLLNSDLYVYYVLMTSSKFGAERRAALTTDIKEFPIIPFESIPQDARRAIKDLVNAFKGDTGQALRKLNDWVFSLYRLGAFDRQIIRDALLFRMPYSDTEQRSALCPKQSEVDRFVRDLENTLQPYFRLTGETISVRHVKSPSKMWKFLSISTNPETHATIVGSVTSDIVNSIAAGGGSSRIYIEQAHGLLVGILAQARYWTPTRARLCAMHIIRRPNIFPIPTDGLV